MIKALRDRFGKKLIHQRCTLHKDRNIQRHLPKRYRYRNGGMMQRWLASVLLYSEKGFRRIKGHALIPAVISTIEAEEATLEMAA